VGLSWGRLKHILREPVPLRSRVAHVLKHAKGAKRVLREWRKETEAFIDLLRERKLLVHKTV
jgi:hypothetical protein